MLYANKRTRIEKDLVTRIHRYLPGDGRITVQVNQELVPQDIIGVSTQKAGFRTINLAAELNVAPNEIKKYLQKPIGQTIFQGELLALKPSSLFQKQAVVVAPGDSMVDFVDENTGNVRLNFIQKNSEVPSAVFGVVEKIEKETGRLTIRTQVTKVHGVLGSGKIRDGVIKLLGKRGDLITPEQVRFMHTDSIVVGGALIYKKAIYNALAVGVSGIITGGINAKDYIALSGGTLGVSKLYGTDVGVSVFVSEGFGSIPIGLDVYEILEQNAGKYGIIDGNKSEIILPTYDPSCMAKVRGTRLPTLAESDLIKIDDVEAVELKVGYKVRVIAGAAMGEQGSVSFIDQSPSVIASGIRNFLITIETRTRKIKVPYANVEVIG